jgi:DNA polymerase-3 subunit alpha
MMLFATLEDMSARIEILVFPKVLQLNPSLWQEDKLILVQGRVSENKEGDIKIIAEKAKELTEKDLYKNESPIKTISLKIKDKNKEIFKKIKETLKNSKGEHRVILKLHYNDDIRKIMLPFGVNLNEDVHKKLEEIVGEPVEIAD